MNQTQQSYREVATSLRSLRLRLERLEQAATAGLGLCTALLIALALT